jgi:hypothetical protein
MLTNELYNYSYQGQKIDLNECKVVFDSYYTNTPYTDPNLIYNLERIHDARNDEKMRSFKLFGMYLDEHLSVSKHAAQICAKLTRVLPLLRRAKHFISHTSKKYIFLFSTHIFFIV